MIFKSTFLLQISFFLLSSTNAQQLISKNVKVSASNTVANTKALFVTDGNDFPTSQFAFCQTSTTAYNWIQIDFPNEYRITKVELVDINLANKGNYNTNIFVVASNDEESFRNLPADTDPYSHLQGNNILMQQLNSMVGDISSTNIATNIKGKFIRIWDNDDGGIRAVEIKIYGTISSMNPNSTNAASTNNANSNTTSNQQTTNSNTDANQNIDEKIRQAISRKDIALINTLLKNNVADFNQSHVDAAFTGNSIDIGKRIITTTGIKPSDKAINSMLAANKSAQVLDLLNNSIIEGSATMLNNCLKTNQGSLVSYLSKRVKPNSETFQILAEEGNSDLFEELIDNDNKLPNNKAINIAIDKNNNSIVNLGLNNGGNANEALNYALEKDNIEMVKLIATRKGVNVNKVFKYAIQKNDEGLFTSIVTLPSSDAKAALDEAMKAKKYDLAMIALDTKRTLPTKYLQEAVEIKNIELAKKIVTVGGDANAGMEAAIKKNNFELTEFFINNGASPTIPKYIETAAVFGSLEIMKLLVESGASPSSGISSAALNGREDVVSYLLDKGADANLGIALGAFSGSLPVVKMLVEKGANPTKGVENAAAQNKVDVLSYLIENGAELSSPKLVAAAVGKNYTEVFKLLVEKGAAISGSNLLQIAATNGNVEIAAILLDNKFNPNEGMLPAIQKNRPDVLQLLLEKGAEIKESYANDAVNNKAALIIPVLYLAGSDFKKTDGLGNTFLHIAATNNDPQTVEELIKAGVPLDAQNVKGNTALHIAADLKDRVPIIMLLAKAGADLNIKNNKGNTPRDVAPALSKTKKALKELGAQ